MGTVSPQPPTTTLPELQLQLEEALACGSRLWLRGRLVETGTAAEGAAKESRWWERWRRKPDAPPTAHLESRIGGLVFSADVPIHTSGAFEATFVAPLPPAQRGWRIARNRVTLGKHTAEKCGIVLQPPAEARGAVLVILPVAFSQELHGAQAFARSDLAARLRPVLRRLQAKPHGPSVFCYLACLPVGEDNRQAELALAATSLGWPSGNFVLLPGDAGTSDATLLHGIDRLRWLFAETLDLSILNLEPSLALPLRGVASSTEDRALIRRLVNPDEDPASLFRADLPAPSRLALHDLRPTRGALVPRHPIVFCHGMLAFSRIQMHMPKEGNYFVPLREFLRERGFRALFPRVEPTGGVKHRAKQLREQILRWTDEPVNLVGHSMGGLDARYLITHLCMSGRVRSLTTISTPHRGTYLSDWFLANYRQRVPLLLALEALGMNVDGFRDVGPAACREFNACTPDSPLVRYFSYGSSVSQVHCTPVLRRAWNLLNTVEGPNDGLVSVASARWGEYLGTLHVDHFAQTPDMAFVHPTETFDPLAFYFRLLQDLARRGF
jgi:triacylglycerol lipase